MSTPATGPATADQATAPAPTPAPDQTNEQRPKEVAEKRGVIDKIKQAISKRFGSTSKSKH